MYTIARVNSHFIRACGGRNSKWPHVRLVLAPPFLYVGLLRCTAEAYKRIRIASSASQRRALIIAASPFVLIPRCRLRLYPKPLTNARKLELLDLAKASSAAAIKSISRAEESTVALFVYTPVEAWKASPIIGNNARRPSTARTHL